MILRAKTVEYFIKCLFKFAVLSLDEHLIYYSNKKTVSVRLFMLDNWA